MKVNRKKLLNLCWDLKTQRAILKRRHPRYWMREDFKKVDHDMVRASNQYIRLYGLNPITMQQLRVE